MKFRVFILTGLLVGVASLAVAQGFLYESYYNWNFLGSGARARGMGGAFLAVSDDGSAATWNPAGLPYNEGVQTSMNWNLFHATVKNNPTGFGEASGDLGNIGFWSFVAPMTLREHEFVLGVSYYRLQDIFYEDGIAAEFTITEQAIEVEQNLDSRVRSVGSLAAINLLGLGTEITSNLTVGGGISLALGDRKDETVHYGYGEPYEYQGVTFVDSLILKMTADVDYSGIFGNLGCMYRTDKWSAAITYTSPWTLTQELDYGTFLQNVVHDIHYDATEALFITERKIKVPYSIGLGGSYRVNDKLLVALDYQYRKFKGGYISTQQTLTPIEDEHEGITNPVSRFTDLPTGWYNLHQIRIGAEYVVESDYGKIPLRVGFHNVPMVAGNTSGTMNTLVQYYNIPVFDIMVEPNNSEDQNMGIGFSFGAGIHWSQVHLDFSYEYENSSTADSGEYWWTYSSNGHDFSDFKLGDYDREYKLKQSRVLLNFTGYF